MPRVLVEENKDRNYSVEKFYEMMGTLLLTPQGLVNCGEYLNLILDEVSKEIIGYVWFSLNFLEEEIFINTISVMKEHRQNGDILNKVFEELKKTFLSTKFKVVRTCSTRIEWHKKNGFVPSKNVLLEYDLTKGECDGQD
ncbi:hypothetical protein OAF54_02090 [bacterium]|nr:hypothetical protein [bacterium]